MSEPKELSAEQYDRVIEAMKNIIEGKELVVGGDTLAERDSRRAYGFVASPGTYDQKHIDRIGRN